MRRTRRLKKILRSVGASAASNRAVRAPAAPYVEAAYSAPRVGFMNGDTAHPMSDEGVIDPQPYFCHRASCTLHIRTGEAGVEGHGDWATLPNGFQLSRRRVGPHMYCDRCASVQLSAASPDNLDSESTA